MPPSYSNQNRFAALREEFKVGEVFNGALEHASERETVKPIWKIVGEILEIKPNGLCIDDGNGDEVFVSFDLIAKHRKQLWRDLRADLGFRDGGLW